MFEYGLYLKIKDGSVLEIMKYDTQEDLEEDFAQAMRILNEDGDWVVLHDILISKDEITLIKKEKVQITLT